MVYWFIGDWFIGLLFKQLKSYLSKIIKIEKYFLKIF